LTRSIALCLGLNLWKHVNKVLRGLGFGIPSSGIASCNVSKESHIMVLSTSSCGPHSHGSEWIVTHPLYEAQAPWPLTTRYTILWPADESLFLKETHTLAKRLCVSRNLVRQDVRRNSRARHGPRCIRKNKIPTNKDGNKADGGTTPTGDQGKEGAGSGVASHLSGLSAVCERYLMKSPGMARPKIVATCGPI
jgi:hypothetical protein